MNEPQIGAQLAATMSAVPDGCVAFTAAVRLLAEGAPVDIARLAHELGWSHERLEAVLAHFPNVERNQAGALVGFALTLRPTRHRFEVDARTLFTWCALDALFLPAVLGRSARVESSCAATGEPIRLRVSPEQVDELEPLGAVVSLVGPCGTDDLRRSFCNEVSFLASADVAHGWLGAHPGSFVVPVAQAFDAGRDFVTRALSVAQQSCCSSVP
ncbi:MAG TPA: organomercurial lyase MerB [Polyangiaceae bacterium]|nr:organomercurial lyase MerB [Polyangiaceae bacterium]